MDTIEKEFIHALATNDRQSLLRYLNSGINIWYVHPDSHWTLLNYAIEHENFEIIETLLKLGLDINHMNTDPGGWGAVHHATESAHDFFVQSDQTEPDTKILELVLSYSPDLTLRDSYGRIPIDYARHDKLKKLLLDRMNNDHQHKL